MKLCVPVITVFISVLLLFNCSCEAERTAAPAFCSLNFSRQSNAFPTANFTYLPHDVTVNHVVDFVDCSEDFDGSILWWYWEFGDGSAVNVTKRVEANQTHEYGAMGSYTVQLTVMDSQSLTNSSWALVVYVRRVNTTLSLDVPSSIGSADLATLTAVLVDEFGDHPSAVPVSFYVTEGQTELSAGVVYTDSQGHASISYAPPNTGLFKVRAVFNGTEVYVGATSDVKDLQVGLDLVPYAVVLSAAVIVMSVVLHYMRVKRRAKESEEPSGKEIEEEEQEEDT